MKDPDAKQDAKEMKLMARHKKGPMMSAKSPAGAKMTGKFKLFSKKS